MSQPTEGLCLVCRKKTMLFHLTTPFTPGHEHEGFHYCTSHNPRWIEENDHHRKTLLDHIEKLVVAGEIKKGDFEVQANLDGTFTIVDFRPDDENVIPISVLPMNRERRRAEKRKR